MKKITVLAALILGVTTFAAPPKHPMMKHPMVKHHMTMKHPMHKHMMHKHRMMHPMHHTAPMTAPHHHH